MARLDLLAGQLYGIGPFLDNGCIGLPGPVRADTINLSMQSCNELDYGQALHILPSNLR